jgi:hypothetical protein
VSAAILVDAVEIERCFITLERDGRWKSVGHYVTINEVLPSGVMVNDLGYSKFDVVVTTAPSYNTQRIEAVNSMMEFVQAFPPAAQYAGDIIARNMDWPGAEELAERLHRAVPPNLLDPKERQKRLEDEPPPEPTPEMLIADSIEKSKAVQSQAKAAEAESDAQRAVAQAQQGMTPELQGQIMQMIVAAMAEIEAGKRIDNSK